MKTKELIRQLNEEDPTGELEVCVDGEDIFTVLNLPAYYDGPQQILIRDEKLSPYYDIVGAIINKEGRKVKIQTIDLECAMFDAFVHDKPFSIEFRGSFLDRELNKYIELEEKIRKEVADFKKGK
jgi:hypothetical protein